MREALAARFDRDFVAVSPAERRPSRVLAVLRPARVLLTHPREAIAGVILLAAATAITVNALGLQKGRHPAPLFADSRVEQRAQAPLPPARPIQSQAQPQPQPQSQPAPASVAPAAAPARPVKPSTSPIAELIRTSEAPVRPAAVTADAKPSRDGIGDLIRAGEAGPRPPANVGDPGRVAAAQRALIKLGYGPLKADGVMGVGTRQALERFEKDRRLPVTGELASRTLRDLTAQSGISVE
jgi:hypothetical protein